jgi:hypothetical protein
VGKDVQIVSGENLTALQKWKVIAAETGQPRKGADEQQLPTRPRYPQQTTVIKCDETGRICCHARISYSFMELKRGSTPCPQEQVQREI